MDGRCAVCGKTFQTTHRTRKYCSQECQWEAMRKEKPKGICTFCGREFIAKRATAKGNFCSHECQVAFLKTQRARKIEAHKEEIQRKKEIIERLKREREQELRRLREEKRRSRVFACKECGEIFLGRSINSKYCSDKCRRKAVNNQHDRRLKRCEKRDYGITLRKVFEKGGGVCCICSRRLSMESDPNCESHPSIDHIIPISKGGDHTWDNVQLLCRRCNSQKGAKDMTEI